MSPVSLDWWKCWTLGRCDEKFEGYLRPCLSRPRTTITPTSCEKSIFPKPATITTAVSGQLFQRTGCIVLTPPEADLMRYFIQKYSQLSLDKLTPQHYLKQKLKPKEKQAKPTCDKSLRIWCQFLLLFLLLSKGIFDYYNHTRAPHPTPQPGLVENL